MNAYSGVKLAEQKPSMNNQLNNDLFLKAVFNTTSVGFAVIDEHGLLIEVNHKLCSMFGYNVSELRGKPIHIIFTETARPNVAALQHSIFNKEQSTQQTAWKGKTKEGSLIDLEINFDLFADEKDDRFVAATFQYKRDEKRINEAPETTHLQYRSVIDNSMQGFFLTKPDGTILDANKAAEEMFGYSAKEFYQIGRNALIDQADPRLQEKLKERDDKGFTNGELICIRKNGERFPVEFSSVIFKAVNGEERTSTMFYDISQRKRAEQQKEFDRLNKEALINSTTDLIWSVNRDYKLIAANKAFSQSLDENYNMYLSPGDSVLAETLSADVLKFWKDLYSRALAGETFTIELNVPQDNSKDDRWNEITFNPIVNNEEVIGVACRGRDITQKSIYHQKLLTVNDQLETAQQIAKLGYWSHDLRTDVLFWSKEVYMIFGVEDQSLGLSSSTFFHHIHTDDKNEFRKQQDLVLNGVAPLQYEYRIVLPNGEIKYVIQKGAVIYDDAKNPLRIEGTIQDITEAKKAELALKVKEEQLNLIYNSTAGIIFLLGVENNGEDFYFISMNNSGLETIGAKPEDLFNKPVREVIPEPSFSLVITKYKEAIQTGKPVVWQEETPYPTGTKTGIVTVTPIYDNEGNCVRLVGSVNDITELKETERSLAISRQQYKSLFDQNPDAVYSLDLEGNFTDFNPGLEKLLECSRQDIIQAGTFVPFCHPDDLEKTVNYFLNVQTGDAQNYDVRAITFTGKLKYLNIINMPIMVDGKITGVYGIAKDITSEKLALLQLELSATQLQNSNIELERFAYIASHDMQEPLRMISSFLQLLEKKYHDSIDEKGREYIRFAVEGSLRMKQLINDLLDYSRVSTSKQNLEKVDIDLVMNDVLQNLSLQIKEKQAVIKADGLPSLPVADKTQMIQLFQNLLSNALKYSGSQQTQIEIAAIEQEDEWLFSVKDNGIGFDEIFADKVFVIFHRLHNKSEYSGTGMGLAICKKIIDRHGGKIYANSVPGEGSTFWFTIKKHLITE
jgi:PAS domain S-box-containing protein